MSNLLLLLGVAILLSSATLLVLKRKEQDTIFKRFLLKLQRESSPRTSPRLPSPTKKRLQSLLTPEYSTKFPPSRRYTLGEAWKASQQDSERILPIHTSYCDAADDMYTPCGFTISEIKAFGDFPNYANLSGVSLPSPYLEFDIKKALPRPYRPFRWPYHQTMSLTKMEPNWWLELENTYEERMKQRSQLFAKHGRAVLQAFPGSELACKELMEMVLQFLCIRYPQYFSLNSDKTILHNTILGTKTDLKQTPPLHSIFQNIPEDFAIMLRNEKTGNYTLHAGIICSSLGWNVNSKIGLQLHEIHAPVPDYKEKMQFSMDRYFAKLPTDKPIQRGSWGLEIDQPLYMPPGDFHGSYRDYQLSNLELSRCHLRVDWQTLRRLPLSGAVLFNFKALFTPVENFQDEPYIPGLLLKVLNEGKKSLMGYKNTWHTEHIIKPALERWHREQIEKEMVEEGWEPKTLDESPYFPGWEEQWHKKQEF